VRAARGTRDRVAGGPAAGGQERGQSGGEEPFPGACPHLSGARPPPPDPLPARPPPDTARRS